MKLHLLILLILILGVTGFTQTKKSTRQQISPTTAALLADVKILTPIERKYCLNILKSLDAADSVFSINRDSFRFFNDIKKVVLESLDNDSKLHKGTLRDALNLLIQNYMDASVLIKLGSIRSKDGKVDIDDEQAEELGKMQRRYGKLLGVGATDDLLDPDNVAKIYASAVNLKTGLYTFIE